MFTLSKPCFFFWVQACPASWGSLAQHNADLHRLPKSPCAAQAVSQCHTPAHPMPVSENSAGGVPSQKLFCPAGEVRWRKQPAGESAPVALAAVTVPAAPNHAGVGPAGPALPVPRIGAAGQGVPDGPDPFQPPCALARLGWGAVGRNATRPTLSPTFLKAGVALFFGRHHSHRDFFDHEACTVSFLPTGWGAANVKRTCPSPLTTQPAGSL